MRYLITSALPYVNANPHIGFAFEILIADALSRFLINNGHKVLFITGTDENSFKIARYAQKIGITPKKLVDENSRDFFDLKKQLNLSYGVFYRTSSVSHFSGAKKFWNVLSKVDLYMDKWSSKYCPDCESFYGNKHEFNKCPVHNTVFEYVSEENIFFHLDKYKKQIKKEIKNNIIRVIPGRDKDFILKLLDTYPNFNISRDRQYNWGVPVPRTNKVMYGFFEALIGYINAVGFYRNSDNFKKWWLDKRTKIIHLCGRDIIKFHAIYWPAILHSCSLRVPSEIIVHGFVKRDGEKMSKSGNNAIPVSDLLLKYDVNTLRYYLLNHNLFEDFSFSESELIRAKSEVEFIFSVLKEAKQHIKDCHKKNSCLIKNKDAPINPYYGNYSTYMFAYDFAEALRIILKLSKLLKKKMTYNVNSDGDVINIYSVLLEMIEPFMPPMV